MYEFRVFDEGDPDTCILLVHPEKYTTDQLRQMVMAETPTAVHSLLTASPARYARENLHIQTHSLLHRVCDRLITTRGFSYPAVTLCDIDNILTNMGTHQSCDPRIHIKDPSPGEEFWFCLNRIVWILMRVFRKEK